MFTTQSIKKIAFHYTSFSVLAMSKPKPLPMSLRLTPEMMARLEAAAKSVQLGRQTLAQRAIEAAIEAVETSGGSLVIPLKLEVADIPIAKANVPEDLAAKDAQVRASRDYMKEKSKLSSAKTASGEEIVTAAASTLNQSASAKRKPPTPTAPPTGPDRHAIGRTRAKQPPKSSP